MDPLLKKLIYLRENLIIEKLNAHDPKLGELIPLMEQNLASTQIIYERDLTIGKFPIGHFKLLDLSLYFSISILDFLVTFQGYFDAKSKWGKL